MSDDRQSSSKAGWLGATLGKLFSLTSENKEAPSSTQQSIPNISNSVDKKSSPNSHNNGVNRFTNETDSTSRTSVRLDAFNNSLSCTTLLNSSRPLPRNILDTSAMRKRQADDASYFNVAKRAKDFSNSMIEEPIRVSVKDKLDSTWSGTAVNASPASSIRSLRSRVSEAPSNSSSGLTSRTKAILRHLETVRTPAKEALKLPIMRTSQLNTELWSTQKSPSVPPLRKANAVPSRIELLSSRTDLSHRKPYWRDIVRQRPAKAKTVESVATNLSAIDPLFDLPPEPKEMNEPAKTGTTLKGVDGKRVNVFDAKGLDDEPDNVLPVPNAITMPKVSVPEKGFMDDLIFTFVAPKEVAIDDKAEEITTVSIDDDSDESDSDASSVSSNDSSSDDVVPIKSSARPSSSADSETTATPSSSRSGSGPEDSADKLSDDSSKVEEKGLEVKEEKTKEKTTEPLVAPSVPAAKVAADWTCSECWVPNKASAELCVACATKNPNFVKSDWDCPDCCVKNKGSADKCVCCGYTANKSTDKSTNVFGDRAFKPAATGGSFSFGTSSSSSAAKPMFGFGTTTTVSSATTAAAPTTLGTITSVSAPTATSSTPAAPLFGFAKPEATSTAAPLPSIPISSSAAPQPFFGLSKPVSEPVVSSTPAVIVSEQSSKPLSSMLGSSNSTSSPFTFGQSNLASSIPASATETLGSSTTTAPVAAKPLFGTTSSLFGTTPAATSAPPATTTALPTTNSLFGTPAVSNAFGSLPSTSGNNTNGSLTALAPPAVSDATKSNLFGSTVATTTSSMFGTPSTTTAAPLFGNPMSSAAPLFAIPTSSSATSLFSNVASNGTSQPAPAVSAAPSESLFGTSGNLFGNSLGTTTKPQFSIGNEEPKKPSFGAFNTTNPTTAFGSLSDAPAAKRPFGSSNALPSFAPTNNSNSSNPFGSNNSIPSFGASTSTPAFGQFSQPPQQSGTLSNSSSTNSLFTSNTEVPSSFNFGSSSNAAPSFGGTNASFNFGASAPSAAPSNAFQFTGAPAMPSNGAFTFGQNSNSAGGPVTGVSAAARKIAQARRKKRP